MRRITVTSNCQTAGIVAALMQIFRGDEITPLPFQIPSATTEPKNYATELARSDIWVTIGGHPWVQQQAGLSGNGKLKTLRIPALDFSGFHPDIAYIYTPGKEEVDPSYQSAIGIWCYKNGVAVKDAVKLFLPQVFNDLGYFDRWYASKGVLKAAFQNSDLKADFDSFFANVQRQGVFMHTINHPMPHALVRLAKNVAIHLGARKSVLDQPIAIPDGLCMLRWPVYPAVAEQLSLDGSFDFVVNDKIVGLKTYLEQSEKRDKARGLRPEDVRFHPRFADAARLDDVLGKHAGIRKATT